MITGSEQGVDAAMYWSVARSIDLLDNSHPSRLFVDHWPELLGLLFLIMVVRAAVMIASAIVEQQVIVPGFYSMVRCSRSAASSSSPTISTRTISPAASRPRSCRAARPSATSSSTCCRPCGAHLTFVVLAITILISLDPLMGAVVAVWFAGYAGSCASCYRRCAAPAATPPTSAPVNGRLVDAFTNIMAVKLFDSGRREHAEESREGPERFLAAVVRLTRTITTVRSSVALLNGVMMSAIGIVAVLRWSEGGISTGAIAAALGLVFRLNQMSGWMMFNINGLIRNFATIQDAIRTISVKPAIRRLVQRRRHAARRGRHPVRERLVPLWQGRRHHP